MGCTSNDVQIIKAYLVDPNTSEKFAPDFVCSGTTTVTLALELTTKTPRIGVTIYGLVVEKDHPSSIVATVSECFGTALNQPTNKVVFHNTFQWTCGLAIVLKDVFLGWGTGNSNFCVGTDFQCPATSSKCFQLPPGEYISIGTPTANTAHSELCSTIAGGTTATFNLTSLEGTVTGGDNTLGVIWYEDATANTTTITTAGTYTSTSKTVYAKVYNKSYPSAFSIATVTLTVYTSPKLVITNPTAVCSPSTIDLSSNSITAGSVLAATSTITATLSYWTDNAGTTPLTTYTAVGNGDYYIKALANTTPSCYDIKKVTATVYNKPNLITTNPAAVCSPSNVNLTLPAITAGSTLYGASLAYWTDNNASIANNDSTHSGAGTYYITANTSTTPSCSDTASVVVTVNNKPSKPTIIITQPTLCVEKGSITICNPITGYLYALGGSSTQTASGGTISFTNLAAGSNPVITVTSSISDGGCTSDGASCSDAVPTCPSFGLRSSNQVIDNVSTQEITFPESKPSVIAYPNPYNNKIRFIVTAPEKGRGGLELFNILGQKIKTVYQGEIREGTQVFETYISPQQRTNLVYVMTLNGKTASGKMIAQ